MDKIEDMEETYTPVPEEEARSILAGPDYFHCPYYHCTMKKVHCGTRRKARIKAFHHQLIVYSGCAACKEKKL